jgi:glycine cleavage system H protein
MSVEIPESLVCTKSHEYVYEEGNLAVIGITGHAVEQLGDIVFIELPEVGAEFEKGEVFGTIESVKAASELYMPISGKVVEINENLIAKPELINIDCYRKGWFIKVEPKDKDELNDAMEYEDYLADIED